jgi:hypothetical protein
VKHGRFDDEERAAIAAAIQEYAEERGLPYGLGEQGFGALDVLPL